MNQINITKIKEDWDEVVRTSVFPARKYKAFLESSILKILDEIDVEECKSEPKTSENLPTTYYNLGQYDGRNKKTKEIKDIITKLKNG